MNKIIKRTSYVLTALVVLVGFGSDALAYDEQFYSSNDIIFFDPRSGACSSGGGTTATMLQGDTIQEKVWNFFVGKGLTAEQIAGVMGNIQAESNFDPAIVEHGNGIGFGIVQWSFGRRTALESAAAQAGRDPADLAFQLDYLFDELNSRPIDRSEFSGLGSNEWEGLTKQTTVEDALVFFHHEFEISHLMNGSDPRAAVIAARGDFARHWFTEFSGGTPTTGTGCSAGVAGEAVHPIADGTRVNEGYGGPRNYGSVTCKGMIWHNGYDLAGQEDQTPVKAIMGGTISGPSGRNNTIRIIHEGGFVSEYLHMNSGSIKVKDGDVVKTGDQIGMVGNTGFSSGAHLHFQIEVSGNTNPEVAKLPVVECGGKYVNPAEFMRLFKVEMCPDGSCDNPITS